MNFFNLFDNMTAFSPDTPKLKPQDYLNHIYYNDFEDFNLEKQSPTTKIKKIKRKAKKVRRMTERKLL